MGEINSSAWQEFKIIDLFYVRNTHSIMKGSIVAGSGNTPYVTASNENNGVLCYINYDENLVEPGDCIMIGGKTLIITYQKEPFFSNDSHNLALYLKDEHYRTERILLFIATALKASIGSRYSWSDSISAKSIQKDTIRLPVDQTGRPDFSYMETYMKNRAVAVSSSLTALQSAKKLELSKKVDTKTWIEFRIRDLFNVKRPAPRSQTNYNEGTVPFVASGNCNNGVLKYLQPNKDEPLEQGGCITVSPVDGSAFYQEKPFLGRGGAGSSVILLYNSALDLYSGYFIATVIRSVCSKYAYSDMANKETIGDEVIKLPADDKNQPDYQFMSEYMVVILEKERRALQRLRTCV